MHTQAKAAHMLPCISLFYHRAQKSKVAHSDTAAVTTVTVLVINIQLNMTSSFTHFVCSRILLRQSWCIKLTLLNNMIHKCGTVPSFSIHTWVMVHTSCFLLFHTAVHHENTETWNKFVIIFFGQTWLNLLILVIDCLKSMDFLKPIILKALSMCRLTSEISCSSCLIIKYKAGFKTQKKLLAWRTFCWTLWGKPHPLSIIIYGLCFYTQPGWKLKISRSYFVLHWNFKLFAKRNDQIWN